MKITAVMAFHSNMIQPAGECWDGSLTKAMADSFPDPCPIPLPCAICTVSNDLAVDETLSPTTYQHYYVDRTAHTQRLERSPPTRRTRLDEQRGRSRIFICGNCFVRCHWSADFLRDLPFFAPPFHFGAASYSSCFSYIIKGAHVWRRAFLGEGGKRQSSCCLRIVTVVIIGDREAMKCNGKGNGNTLTKPSGERQRPPRFPRQGVRRRLGGGDATWHHSPLAPELEGKGIKSHETTARTRHARDVDGYRNSVVWVGEMLRGTTVPLPLSWKKKGSRATRRLREPGTRDSQNRQVGVASVHTSLRELERTSFLHPGHCHGAVAVLDRKVAEAAVRSPGPAGMQGRRKREIPKKTCRPAASSGAIPICENPGMTQPSSGTSSPLELWQSAEQSAAELPNPHKPPNGLCVDTYLPPPHTPTTHPTLHRSEPAQLHDASCSYALYRPSPECEVREVTHPSIIVFQLSQPIQEGDNFLVVCTSGAGCS
ncbi:hypothetical protein PR048_007735 [Dryococelus australis]|uniref:Uncharacterized protein n=1 Tax=Dryococelus australis TaxID=614101 RepID=A0ABQ9HWQ9_9NEOP|nr:hypothetical protein PR048_007735 [Dryococelus australis]